jgi:hypothetical protein
MPVVWLEANATPLSPDDLRVVALIKPQGGVWLTPFQFALGLAKGAFYYGPNDIDFWDWRYDVGLAGIVPAGALKPA